MLPNLINAGKDQKATEFSKTMEFMMLKRLNFLRNQLDGHDPQETTARMRLNAIQKRDERIIELWRKDQQLPSVHDLVANMREQRLNQTRADFPMIENVDDMDSEQTFPTLKSIQ